MPTLPNNFQKSNVKSVSPHLVTTGGKNSCTRLDFLSFSYHLEHLIEAPDQEKSARDLLRRLGFSMRHNRRGYQGFKQSASIFCKKEKCGIVAWEGNRNRIFLSLSGRAFDMIYDSNSFPPTPSKKIPAIPYQIKALRQFFEEVSLKGELRITRADIALDDFRGKLNLQVADQAYQEGGMTILSRTPKHSKFVSDGGSTNYYGSRKSGKMLRVYEKGRQMKSEEFADWVRWEVELRSKDREIPATIIEQTDEHFAGAYPVCQEILEAMKGKGVEGQKISTGKVKAQISKEVMSRNIKRQYGKHIARLIREGVNIKELVRQDYEHVESESVIIVLRASNKRIEELFRHRELIQGMIEM